MSVISIASEAEFDEQLRKASDRLVVVDFFAEWCGPCRMLAPYIHQLAEKMPNIVFLKVDVDDVDDLASRYEISALPTIVFFKNNQKIDQIVGANREKVLAMLESHK